eukprot:102021-Pyramimonas_sp.AAC.1
MSSPTPFCRAPPCTDIKTTRVANWDKKGNLSGCAVGISSKCKSANKVLVLEAQRLNDEMVTVRPDRDEGNKDPKDVEKGR